VPCITRQWRPINTHDLRNLVESAEEDGAAALSRDVSEVSDELLTLEDLDPDFDPDAEAFDGPDELMALDEFDIDVDDFVISKMEGSEEGAAALARMENVSAFSPPQAAQAGGRGAESASNAEAAAAAPSKPPLSKEELLEKWKARAVNYQRNVGEASPQVIQVSKKYDKTAMGGLAVSDVVSALKDLDISLEPSAQAAILAKLERLPEDETKVSVNTLQKLAQRYKPLLTPVPSVPSVAERVFDALGGVLRGAPALFRRTIQDIDTRRSVLRELSSTLVNASDDAKGPGEGPGATVSQGSNSSSSISSSSSSSSSSSAGNVQGSSAASLRTGGGNSSVSRSAPPPAAAAATPPPLRETPDSGTPEREKTDSSSSFSPPSKAAPPFSFPSFRPPSINLGLRDLYGTGKAGSPSEESGDNGEGDRVSEMKEAAQPAAESTGPDADITSPGLRVGNTAMADEPIDNNSGIESVGGAAGGPGTWKAEIDPPTGKTYYWNTETREVTWERPPGMIE
jgi:hypothetical protein